MFRCATSARVNSLTVEVGDGEGVGVGEADLVGVGVGEVVGVGVALTEATGDGEAIAVGVALGDTVVAGDGLLVGVVAGVARTVTPLLQTLLLPFLIHLNSFPAAITTAPNFLQVAPVFGVTALALSSEEKSKVQNSNGAIQRRMGKS